MDIRIGKITLKSWREYRALRLLALGESPQAFGASHDEERYLPRRVWRERLAYMTFAAHDHHLIGMIGCRAGAAKKSSHVAEISGLYVRPYARGRGIASQLLQTVLGEAKHCLLCSKVTLNVVTTQESAIRLYQRFGFYLVGTLKKETCVDGVFYDEHVMELLFV